MLGLQPGMPTQGFIMLLKWLTLGLSLPSTTHVDPYFLSVPVPRPYLTWHGGCLAVHINRKPDLSIGSVVTGSSVSSIFTPTVEIIFLQRNPAKTVSQFLLTKGGLYMSKFSKYHLFKSILARHVGTCMQFQHLGVWSRGTLSSRPSWATDDIVIWLKIIKSYTYRDANQSKPKPTPTTNRSHCCGVIPRGCMPSFGEGGGKHCFINIPNLFYLQMQGVKDPPLYKLPAQPFASLAAADNV